MARASVCPSVGLPTNFVNTIQTELFQLGRQTWYTYYLWQEDELYWFSRSWVKGLGHTLDIVVKPCKHDTDWTVPARTVKLGTHTTKRTTPLKEDELYWFLRSGVKGQGHMLDIVVKPCKQDTDWTVSARTIKLGTLTSYDKKTTPIDFQGHGSKVKVTH